MRLNINGNTVRMSHGGKPENSSNAVANCSDCDWHDHGSTDRVTREAHAHARDHALRGR